MSTSPQKETSEETESKELEVETPVYYTQTGEVVTDPKVIQDYLTLISQPPKRKVNIIKE